MLSLFAALFHVILLCSFRLDCKGVIIGIPAARPDFPSESRSIHVVHFEISRRKLRQDEELILSSCYYSVCTKMNVSYERVVTVRFCADSCICKIRKKANESSEQKASVLTTNLFVQRIRFCLLRGFIVFQSVQTYNND